MCARGCFLQKYRNLNAWARPQQRGRQHKGKALLDLGFSHGQVPSLPRPQAPTCQMEAGIGLQDPKESQPL